ncbi:class I SAM-dependent DNA methyltransferase [Clostridium oryzae]|uniref:class I SAM-dependent DNA methyltransferase n=1 Tax=Clostridium oryzae TaxID=1450648 RepID=UPI0009A47274|nr:class I SAM-dependent methyltransferase [Clostridium oryzae]
MEAYKKFASIYDGLIREDVDYEKWAKVILDHCKKNNVHELDYLDVGCGTGNMALEVGKFFRECWCVDNSEEMLIKASDKLTNTRKKFKFICQDMEYLNLNRKFDLITCVLDCTNYLTEDGMLQNFIQAISKHIKDEGLFIFDINSAYKLEKILGNNVFTYNTEDVVYLWENTLDNNKVTMDITFFVKHDNLYERFEEFHEERIYTISEIEETLKKNNLNVICKLDNYSEKSISKDTERITFIVKKGI